MTFVRPPHALQQGFGLACRWARAQRARVQWARVPLVAVKLAAVKLAAVLLVWLKSILTSAPSLRLAIAQAGALRSAGSQNRLTTTKAPPIQVS